MHARIRDSQRSVRYECWDVNNWKQQRRRNPGTTMQISEIYRGPSTSFQRCKTRQPTAENITITHGHLKHQLQDPTACILQPTKVFQHYSITYNPYFVYSQPGWPPNSRKCKNANDHKPKTALKSLLPDEDSPLPLQKVQRLPPSFPDQFPYPPRTPPTERHCNAPEPNRVTPPEKETDKT